MSRILKLEIYVSDSFGDKEKHQVIDGILKVPGIGLIDIWNPTD